MKAKRVIQTYKPVGQWANSPPGLGDFVRGACHLFERLQDTGMELRLDVSQTGFADLIEQDASTFHAGDKRRIGEAAEYFEDEGDRGLFNRLAAFQDSGETELYVCANLGAWNRLSLPDSTRAFISGFYAFNADVERLSVRAMPASGYEVLSVRCGDRFYSDPSGKISDDVARRIDAIIERHVLPQARLPLVVTSDCHALKIELSSRYGMLMLPHRSQHGACGNALPVALDLCLLKHSRFNYHINVWTEWWSGFSHYTSMIFKIPSLNFRPPRFATEEITADGQLVAPPWWHRFSGF